MRFLSAVVVGLLLAARSARADDDVRARLAAVEARVTTNEDETAVRLERIAKVSGYVDFDWTVFRQSSENELTPAGQPLNEDRFLIRRARIRFERDAGYVHGALEIDANTITGPQVRPWNAEVSVKWPADRPYSSIGPSADPTVDQTRLVEGPFVMVSGGLLLTPFGFEPQELERQRPFLERSTFSNALVPQSYDLGIRALGGWRWANWALGIMNGDPIGEQTFPGRDPNKSKDLVFRLGGKGPVGERMRVAAGVSGLTGRGFHTGTPATKDQLVWRDANEDGLVDPSELTSIAGSGASPSQTFSRFAVGVDARVSVEIPWLGPLALRAELVRAQNLDRGAAPADPIAASRDLHELGWYLGGTQDIGKYALVGIRHDLYRPDDDASDRRPFAVVPRDTSLHTTSLLAMVRWPGVGRLVAQFDVRTNRIGRGTNGEPTNLRDDSFTLRAEAIF